MPTFTDSLRWRYATKKFDTAKKLTDAQLDELLEAANLSASSYGLQPYRLVVVKDPAIRAKIREHAWGQAQVTDASHLIVICPMRSIDEAYVAKYIDNITKTRGMPAGNLKGFHDMMVGSIKAQTPEKMAAWLKCQAYIAVGFLLSAAASAGIDACPMEGFDPAHVDVDLGLLDKNLTSAVMVPVGFRAADDESASYKKVRLPKDEFVLHI
ncbi:MAG TPA: NAD(P)H-dependent oxidoreductase [Candidatus Peribacteria bacterium]|nr:NAD(P)H-dependent oxidoreductase [Candidatus Peribacteria bacterium]